MIKLIYSSIIFLLVFTGCSTRQNYEPVDSFNFDQNTKELSSSIIDINPNGATLEDYSYVSQKGLIKESQSNYKFLNFSDDTLITADNNGSINLKNENLSTLSFDKNIISAAKDGQLLAFSSIDNSISLFDLEKKKIVFKEYLKHSTVNNIKIANPVFLNTVILYPTLDGKVVIVDLAKKVIVKTINIDPKSDVNNIIFLEETNNTLVASSSKKIFTFIDGKVNIKDVDVQDIIVDNKFIYVATLDGQIIKYDLELKEIASKKFKFAKFYAIASGNHIYALESQEYLIRINKDFDKFKVFDFSFDEEEKVLSIDNTIYFEDEYIVLD